MAFNDVAVALQDHLAVLPEDLQRYFHKTLKWTLSGTSWYVKLLPDQKAIVGKKNGKCYMIGIQIVKAWDKTSQSMKEKNFPAVIEGFDKGIPVRSANYGHRPDSFEAPFSGVHPADE